ncbi:hypothetical protein RZS08_20050, partial [Arthrospira platensis SPKY1]|nr:hypothetical protein [Arthrospira platensis SPKY1]
MARRPAFQALGVGRMGQGQVGIHMPPGPVRRRVQGVGAMPDHKAVERGLVGVVHPVGVEDRRQRWRECGLPVQLQRPLQSPQACRRLDGAAVLARLAQGKGQAD